MARNPDDSFKTGSAFALALKLLRQHWRKLLWLYGVFLMAPGVILGELGDTPSDPLYALFNNPRFIPVPGALTLFAYAYQIPTALFLSLALAVLLQPDEKPWAGGRRAFITTFLLLLLPSAISVLTGDVMSAMPSAGMIYATQLFFWLVSVIISLFLFVAPAVATSRFNPAHALGRSVTLVWPHWFRVLLFVAVIGAFSIASEFAEQWLLISYQTPDGSALDWLTTILQELIRSGYQIISACMIAATYQLLLRSREGPPATETVAVFD